MAECNETTVSTEQSRDIYHVDEKLCNYLVDQYDKSVRQIFNLAKAWDKFKNRRKTTP